MKKRKRYDATAKARIALEAIKETKTLNQIAAQFDVHANQVSAWKKEMLEKMHLIFEKDSPESKIDESPKLFEEIGRLKVENNFLKKNLKLYS